MVVFEQPDGLCLHSPVPVTEALAAAVESIGPVAHLVSPNRSHHLFVPAWAAHYPEARIWRPGDFPGGTSSFGDLRTRQIAGVPGFDEQVFLHPDSRTLVVTDLVLHVLDDPSIVTRTLFRMIGAYGRAAQAYPWRLRTRNRRAARESLEEVLDWPFERILMAHGTPIERGGKDVLRAACRWLLDPAADGGR